MPLDRKDPYEVALLRIARLSVDELRQALDLPGHAICMGFGLQKDGGKTFLAGIGSAGGEADWKVAAESALMFGWQEALRISEVFPCGEVVLMFDLGEVIMVYAL